MVSRKPTHHVPNINDPINKSGKLELLAANTHSPQPMSPTTPPIMNPVSLPYRAMARAMGKAVMTAPASVTVYNRNTQAVNVADR
jgi:hypothetical protein